MSPILVAGTVIVQFALVAYTIGIVAEQRSHRVNRIVLTFLTLGIVFDVTATGFMIAGSERGFTLHAALGFSSLAGMLLETTLAWRHHLRFQDGVVSRGLHLYSRYAFLWWVAAYIAGAALVIASRSQ